MPVFTTIPVNNASNERIDTFGGYNHNMKIGDGEFFDMKNLGSDEYPLLANRRKRGIMNNLKMDGEKDFYFSEIYGMTPTAAGDLFVVGKAVYYSPDEEYIDDTEPKLYLIYKSADEGKYTKVYDYSDNANRGEGTLEGDYIHLSETQKQLFCTGDEVYIFPDKWYVKIEIGATGVVFAYRMDARKEMKISATMPSIKYTPCDIDGKDYTGQTVSATAPQSPSEGDIWVDTSNTIHIWKKWTVTEWVEIPKVYVKIKPHSWSFDNFNEGDGIDFWTSVSASDNPQVHELNGSHVIQKVKYPQYIVITGILDEEYTQTAGSATIKRSIPDMDFIVLAQNRLWGCRYGSQINSVKNVNEIYASKLGDFNNWNVFEGISTDSYAASVGTPGKWTGAANVNGYPTFFKEDHFHKVYVSSSGAHQIIDKPCHGVQDACGGSVVVVGDICYYKSKNGVMAFDGASFNNIGAVFGRERYVAADGGAVADKYYISMQSEIGEWAIFAYDTRKGLWHKEDNTHALNFCNSSGDSFFCTETDETATINTISEFDISDNYEDALEWEAVTGLQGYGYIGQKYISRFNLRMQLPKGSYMDVFVEYDSDGTWRHQGHIKGTGTRSFILPIRPRRCDHFRIKLTGKGEVKVYSFAKYFEGGSDVI